VDAAFVASVRVDAYLNSGRISRDTFNVPWRSVPIYYNSCVVSGTLCSALKEKIRVAMLNDQEGLAGFFKSQGGAASVPASHAEQTLMLPMLRSPAVAP